jgi:hypothetical protein
MTAHIAISYHAAQRITERLEPTLGADAEAIVVDAVLDAVWNCRYRRSAPRWLRAADKRRGDSVRYVVRSCVGVRFTAIVCVADPALPKVITILTDRMPQRALPAVPVLADGRVIGLPRTRPLPVAFHTIAA